MDQRELRCLDRRCRGRSRLGTAARCAGKRTSERLDRHAQGPASVSRDWESQQRARAYESILAAEGSDWNWWYGPEHGSANDAEFDALYRKHLTEVYRALGEPVPDALARPIKRAAERARREAPMAYLEVKVDGRESNYFEWLGAGLYATDRRQSAMHGRAYVLGDLHYGFGPQHFYVRVDPIPEVVAGIPSFQIRLTVWDSRETQNHATGRGRQAGGMHSRAGGTVPAPSGDSVSAAYGKILEVGLARELFDLRGRRELLLGVALWKGGLPARRAAGRRHAERGAGRRAFCVARRLMRIDQAALVSHAVPPGLFERNLPHRSQLKIQS